MTLTRTISDDRTVMTGLAPEIRPPADATTAVSAAMHSALQQCVQTLGVNDSQAVARGLRQGDIRTHSAFSYALAKQMAEQIAAIDSRVKAVYLYDYDATTEDACFIEPTEVTPTPLIHLLVWAQPKTGALNSIITAFDDALARAYGDLVQQPGDVHMLDAQVVDDAVVESRSGYGAMLSSPHYRPLRLWQR